MFNKKQKEIKKLKKECKNLKRQIDDIKSENKELREIRLLEVRNNTKISEQNNIKTELINSIEELVNSNKYNREDKILSKIKELVRDYQSNN